MIFLINKEYYKSNKWQEIRQARMKYDGYRCQKCGSSENLQVHHKDYVGNGREVIKEDLITVCERCHRKETNIDRRDRNKARKERGKWGKESSQFWW